MSAAVASVSLIALLSTVPYHPAPIEPSDQVMDLLESVKTGEVFGVLARPVAQSIPELICSMPWPCDQALRVARCESTLNPRAVSPAGHAGLFQLDPRFHAWRVGGDPARLLNAADNVQAAYGLWSERGWQPWSCR